MNGVSPILKEFADFRVIVAFVHAHVLWRFACRFRFLRYDAFQCWLHQLHIMPVRAIHCKPDRYAVTFNEEASLGSRFPSVCRVGACVFFPQEEPSSLLHP